MAGEAGMAREAVKGGMKMGQGRAGREGWVGCDGRITVGGVGLLSAPRHCAGLTGSSDALERFGPGRGTVELALSAARRMSRVWAETAPWRPDHTAKRVASSSPRPAPPVGHTCRGGEPSHGQVCGRVYIAALGVTGGGG